MTGSLTYAFGLDLWRRESRLQPPVAVSTLAKSVATLAAIPELDLPQDRLDEVARRLQIREGMGLSALVHAMHLFGPTYRVAVGPSRVESMAVADLLLDVPKAATILGGNSILAATRHGLQAPLYREGYLGTDQSAALSHRGQFLAILGGLGVAGSRPIRLSDGSTRPVIALRDDMIANFSLDGEIAWDAVALGYYWDRPTWSNKFGREFSFDQLAQELASRGPEDASCGGVHDMTALTTLVKIDRIRPIFTGSARDQVVASLTRRVAQVLESQLADGSWNLHWHDPVLPGRPAGSPATSGDSLIVTGHLLEWLTSLPEPMRADPGVFRRGASWLLASVQAVGDDTTTINKLYCPLIHATRSLRLLSRTVEPRVGL